MPRIFFDVEVYRNYFLALLMSETGKVRRYEIFDGDDSGFDGEEILEIMSHPDAEIVSFNGISYDVPMLTLAIATRDTKAVKRESDRIIEENLRPWDFYRQNGLREPVLNHIDIINVAPGQVGLKLYGGRMGTRRLQELPINPAARISPEDVPTLRRYCRNDTRLTQELFEKLRTQIDLRRAMSQEYGIDLRSKSDAQIAEAVLKSEYARMAGKPPKRPSITYSSFYYKPPGYLKFLTPDLQAAFDAVCSAEMVLDPDTGHVKMPETIARLKIKIGQSTYKIGIGGLHSQESEITHKSDDRFVLIDRDVESYYPNLMLNMNMRPGGFGEYFNAIYRKILEERLEAKRAGAKVKSDSLKIVLNGTFGKTSNQYSTLYSPKFMIRTTLTGQLTLLMLIEMLELCGIPVVSANTDGIVIKCPRDREEELLRIIVKWEQRSGLKTEETRYKALYSRDVNNYIAIKEDGSVKTKGVYAPVSLSKNPQVPICAEAVVAYLSEGTPLKVTLEDCTDVRKFLMLRTVTGGAVKDGVPLGKAIRWYYGRGETGTINYATNGNLVPRSEGAKPLMDLPDEFPGDIDYKWYLRECEEILMSLGAIERPYVEKIPRKNSKAWKELRDCGKIVETPAGKWVWKQET